MHFHSMSNIQQYMHMYVVIACNGPILHMCAYTDNTAMTTDLMVTRYQKCSIHSTDVLRLRVGYMQHVLEVKCSTYIV